MTTPLAYPSLQRNAATTSTTYAAELPLAPLQVGMAIDAARGADAGADIEQLVVRLPEAVDPEALRLAWEEVCASHVAFWASFHWTKGGKPCQRFSPAMRIFFNVLDWSEPGLDFEAKLQRFLAEDRAQGFDLTEVPLSRWTLIRRADSDWVFVWTFHHILLDGRSLWQIFGESFDRYDMARDGRVAPSPEPTSPLEFLEHVAGLDHSGSASVWRSLLAGVQGPTPIPFEGLHVSRAGQSVVTRHLPAELLSAMTFVARSTQVTPSTIVQAAWACLLARHARQSDVVFGVTRALHPSVPQNARPVGLLLNTLPLRVEADGVRTVRDLLTSLREQWVSTRAVDCTPLLTLRELAGVAVDQPLFRSYVMFENRDPIEQFRSRGPQWKHRHVELLEQTTIPMGLNVFAGDGLRLMLRYDHGLIETEEADRLLVHYESILQGIVEDADRPLQSLELLDADERARLMELSGPGETFPVHETLAERFETQVAKSPDAPALTLGDRTLSYRELDRRAGRLARRLVEQGVALGEPVALCCTRSIEMVVAMLAVAKAGGAYVPLDPTYPDERIRFSLEDCGARVVLGEAEVRNRLEGIAVEWLDVRTDLADVNDDEFIPTHRAAPDSLAYVIYTSGSTGKPKGVRVTHRNVLRLFDATDRWFQFGDRDVWTLFHSYAFDFSVWEMWGALLYGGRLVVVPFSVSRSPEEFRALLVRERVTVLNQTPSAFYELLRLEAHHELASWALRWVIFGGEALDLGALRPWFARYGDRSPTLVNMYGITETTVHVTYRPLRAEDAKSGTASLVGVPIPDLRLYLCDAAGRLAPLGAPGEIWVGGGGVADGYLNRPDQTTQRFVPDVFGGDPDAKIYRSGDLARYRSDGDLEYLGRIDDQVKIRGFRIELGEIQSVVTSHPTVEQAAVLVWEPSSGDQRLVAYVVPQAGQEIWVDELRDACVERLPAYMVPTFVVIDQFPMTPNGKIDRRALPTPTTGPATGNVDGPRDSLELMLVELFCDVLGLESVGVHANFFELGGHSLLALRVLDRASRLGLNVSPEQFFQSPTIAGLAESATMGSVEDRSCLVRLQPNGHRTPIYFLHSVPGDLLGYGNLVHHLGDEFPCYGFQANGLLDPQGMHRSIPEMAAYYVRLLQRFQPSGPFYLVGWCFGGQVALAMSEQLAALGRPPAQLILIESFPRDGWGVRRRARQLEQLVRRGPRAWAKLARRVRTDHPDVDPVVKFALSARSGIFRNRMDVYQANNAALPRHRDPKYDGPTVVVRGNDPTLDLKEEDYGWSRLLPRIDLVRLTGDHETILKEPHVAAVADLFLRTFT